MKKMTFILLALFVTALALTSLTACSGGGNGPSATINNPPSTDDGTTTDPGDDNGTIPDPDDGDDNGTTTDPDNPPPPTIVIGYLDADGDGYGAGPGVEFIDFLPEGYVTNNDDWDDTDSYTYPDAPEICDGKDNDGNDIKDEGLTCKYQPIADTYVDQVYPDENFGVDDIMVISARKTSDGTYKERLGYVKFDIPRLDIANATLTVSTGTYPGQDPVADIWFCKAANSGWEEGTATYENTSPHTRGYCIQLKGIHYNATDIEISGTDFTDIVAKFSEDKGGELTFTLQVTQNSSPEVAVYTSEFGEGLSPVLEITTND